MVFKMLFVVFKKHQIRGAIVAFIVVDMVNNFIRKKLSFYFSFHNESVLQDVTPFCRGGMLWLVNQDVTFGTDKSSTFPRLRFFSRVCFNPINLANFRAKRGCCFFNFMRKTNEWFIANFANKCGSQRFSVALSRTIPSISQTNLAWRGKEFLIASLTGKGHSYSSTLIGTKLSLSFSDAIRRSRELFAAVNAFSNHGSLCPFNHTMYTTIGA